LHRAEIDARLVQHRCNVAQLGREYKVSRTSLTTHRDQHIGAWLRVYGANASLPTLGELHGEYLRLYAEALDSLALAQAGTIVTAGEGGESHRIISQTQISRAISEARKVVDRIVTLAADAAEPEERPAGLASGELTARIRAQLERVVAKGGAGIEAIDGAAIEVNAARGVAAIEVNAVECIEEGSGSDFSGAGAGPVTERAGGVAGGRGALRAGEIGLDGAEADSDSSGAGVAADVWVGHRELAVVVADDAETRVAIHQEAAGDREIMMMVPNPGWPGSAAASVEERTAGGWPDVPVTRADLVSLPDQVRRLIAEAQRAGPSPSP